MTYNRDNQHRRYNRQPCIKILRQYGITNPFGNIINRFKLVIGNIAAKESK